MNEHLDRMRGSTSTRAPEEPILIRGLLSPEECRAVVQAGSAAIWPNLPSQIDQAARLSPELRSLPHHICLSNNHVCFFYHGEKEKHLASIEPAIYSKLKSAMVADKDRWGTINGELNERCVELHTYTTGGGLLTSGHRDCGSKLTMSVLLSPDGAFDGGEFVTFKKGLPVKHETLQGDAVLFDSEALHNVLNVTRGMRQSLVIELWNSAPISSADRG